MPKTKKKITVPDKRDPVKLAEELRNKVRKLEVTAEKKNRYILAIDDAKESIGELINLSVVIELARSGLVF